MSPYSLCLRHFSDVMSHRLSVLSLMCIAGTLLKSKYNRTLRHFGNVQGIK